GDRRLRARGRSVARWVCTRLATGRGPPGFLLRSTHRGVSLREQPNFAGWQTSEQDTHPAANVPAHPEAQMQESGVYGEAFGRRLQARATAFVSRSLQKATLAVTELRYDSPQHVLSTPP